MELFPAALRRHYFVENQFVSAVPQLQRNALHRRSFHLVELTWSEYFDSWDFCPSLAQESCELSQSGTDHSSSAPEGAVLLLPPMKLSGLTVPGASSGVEPAGDGRRGILREWW